MQFKQPALILASSSERRMALLNKLGVHFIAAGHKLAAEPKFDESGGGASIGRFVENLALSKAESLAGDYPENFIIGSDTLIYLDGKVYGKPENTKDAFNMIRELSGKYHEVYSGIGLVNKSKSIHETAFDKTAVKIKKLRDDEIEYYIKNYRPLDKAGSYGIQDDESIVESYTGSFENVLGLPVRKLIPLLKKYGML